MISEPVGAWTPDWRDASHIVDIRWPYVFVAAFEGGLQIFNLFEPKNPVIWGWYYTCACWHQQGRGGSSVLNGAADIDVRNADGLIVMTDCTSGFWAFRLKGSTAGTAHTGKCPTSQRNKTGMVVRSRRGLGERS